MNYCGSFYPETPEDESANRCLLVCFLSGDVICTNPISLIPPPQVPKLPPYRLFLGPLGKEGNALSSPSHCAAPHPPPLAPPPLWPPRHPGRGRPAAARGRPIGSCQGVPPIVCQGALRKAHDKATHSREDLFDRALGSDFAPSPPQTHRNPPVNRHNVGCFSFVFSAHYLPPNLNSHIPM